MSDARNRIFISYSTKDGKDEAAALRDELKNRGFSVGRTLLHSKVAKIGGPKLKMLSNQKPFSISF